MACPGSWNVLVSGTLPNMSLHDCLALPHVGRRSRPITPTTVGTADLPFRCPSCTAPPLHSLTSLMTSSPRATLSHRELPTSATLILVCQNTRSAVPSAATTSHLSTPGGWCLATPQRQIQPWPSGAASSALVLDSFVSIANPGNGAEPLSSFGDLSLFHVSTAALSISHPFVLISTSRTPTMGETDGVPGRHPIKMSSAPVATYTCVRLDRVGSEPPPCIVPSTASTPRAHVACFSMCV